MTNYNFSEVINEYSRLCTQLQSNCTPETCPIFSLIAKWEEEHNEDWDARCIEFSREQPDAFAEAVIAWSKKNPQKIYPTIGEVVRNLAIKSGLSTADIADIYKTLQTRISEEAAEYFGIRAINDCKLP